MSRFDRAKKEVWEAAKAMFAHGLVTGSSGNVSLRISHGDGSYLVAVTPSQIPYEELQPQQILITDPEGEPVEGELMPSSESALHLQIYKQRRDVQAVVHTHSVYASVVAVTGEELPPIIDEAVLAVGGSVPISDYAFPGTEELAQKVCHALGQCNAVLIRNHGVVGVGRSLRQALEVCHLVERVAQIFVYSQLLGKTNLLPPEIVKVQQELYYMQKTVHESEGGQNDNST